MLEKINGMKSYVLGGLFILTGVLQMACSLAGICLLPDTLTLGAVDANGVPQTGWALILAGWGIIAAKSAVAKLEPPKA